MGNSCSPNIKLKKKIRRDRRWTQNAIVETRKFPGFQRVITIQKFNGEESNYEETAHYEVNEIYYVIAKEFKLKKDWIKLYRQQEVSAELHEIGVGLTAHLADDDGSPKNLLGWRNIYRSQAEKHLLRPGIKIGQYIIRPSTKSGCYAMSVRGVEKIMNYLIQYNSKEQSYYINSNISFRNSEELVQFYRDNPIGSNIILSLPYPHKYSAPVKFKDIEIQRNDLSQMQEIGSGNFGTVYFAKMLGQLPVAVKRLTENKASDTLDPQQQHQVSPEISEAMRREFIEEAKTLHQLRHEYIVELMGVCTKPNNEAVLIVTEYMENGSMKQYLQDRQEDNEFEVLDILSLLTNIVSGMAYLEESNVVHKDLRTANVLVDCDGTAKVADFGLAKMIKSNEKIICNDLFPIRWAAPESLIDHEFSSKSDVWAFGILMYETVTFAVEPYRGMKNAEVKNFVINGNILEDPNVPTDEGPHFAKVLSDETIYKLMTMCWKWTANERPCFSELKEELFKLYTSFEKSYN